MFLHVHLKKTGVSKTVSVFCYWS